MENALSDEIEKQEDEGFDKATIRLDVILELLNWDSYGLSDRETRRVPKSDQARSEEGKAMGNLEIESRWVFFNAFHSLTLPFSFRPTIWSSEKPLSREEKKVMLQLHLRWQRRQSLLTINA